MGGNRGIERSKETPALEGLDQMHRKTGMPRSVAVGVLSVACEDDQPGGELVEDNACFALVVPNFDDPLLR